jgi:UDP-glucose 4-epimerase
VTVLDDLGSGCLANLPRAHPGLVFHRVTVGDPSAREVVEASVAAADLVIHLASPIGVGLAHSRRFFVVRNILAAGIAIVDACRRFRRPLVMCSSSEVYGPGSSRPIDESQPLILDISARWGYASAKLALEHLAAGLHIEDQIPTWIIRPFNVAGPRQRPATGLVVAAFVDAVRRGQSLSVHGDGSQKRAFLHVADAAEAILRISSCPALAGQPVNIGGVEAYSIVELAQLVIDVTGIPVPIVFRPVDSVYGSNFSSAGTRIPDIGLLHASTGWLPTRSTADAVRDCLASQVRQLAPEVN